MSAYLLERRSMLLSGREKFESTVQESDILTPAQTLSKQSGFYLSHCQLGGAWELFLRLALLPPLILSLRSAAPPPSLL